MNVRIGILTLLLAAPWLASSAVSEGGLPAVTNGGSPLPAGRAASPASGGDALEELRGTVRSAETPGAAVPVAGANVFWLGTTIGTTSDASGAFVIPRVTGHTRLVVRHAAFAPDTLVVTDASSVTVTLRPSEREVEEVSVTGDRTTTTIDYLSPESKIRMGEQELAKAACCNLSESFETNPSIDVTFTDAITGTRHIEMLGLSGIYAQTTLENLPYIRGLTSNVGLTFIPGSWIEAINVSRGIGSVANGYESITGQIDVDLRKPQKEDEPRLFANAFGNQDARFEGNLNLRQPLGDNWSSMTFLHASSQKTEVDDNGDGFLDMPRFTGVNFAQRFNFSTRQNWEGQLAIQYVGDRREGGTRQRTDAPAPDQAFIYTNRGEYIRVSGKTGYVFADDRTRSFGLQWSLGRYRNNSAYGPRDYDATEKTGYVNLIYQSDFGDPVHRFRTGLSVLYDEYDERFDARDYGRVERVPGAFFEYTFAPSEVLTIVGGLRADVHNAYGTFASPRLHVRYSPDEDWVFRAVAGRGYRTANIFAENATVFASTRTVTITPTNDFGYGLMQESAWNIGVSATRYFMIEYRPATIAVDVHRTTFEQQVVADLDSHPGEVHFYGIEGGSYATSAQVELNMQAVEGLDTRLAYRFLDVRQTLNGVLLQKALSAQHRALVNLAYALDDDEGAQRTAFDVTVQWFGPKRIPNTGSNPPEFRAREWSPSFATVNAQISRTFSPGLEVYLGGENLFNFKQDDPIIDPGNPTSPYFDASLVWGPISGRMVYAGVRYRL
jgi:outer membrane receptor for ferrienterochelin and colicins